MLEKNVKNVKNMTEKKKRHLCIYFEQNTE
jgi:hypothetical protein